MNRPALPKDRLEKLTPDEIVARCLWLQDERRDLTQRIEHVRDAWKGKLAACQLKLLDAKARWREQVERINERDVSFIENLEDIEPGIFQNPDVQKLLLNLFGRPWEHLRNERASKVGA